MSVRPTTWALGGVLALASAAAAFVLVPRASPPAPPPRLVAAPESSEARAKREALDAMGPGRMLGKPASVAPESVVLAAATAQADAGGPTLEPSDGPLTALVVTTPPFEVTKRYRSMEGPFAEYKIRLDGAPAKPRARELWWWKGAKIEMLDDADRPLDQELMCHLNIDVDRAFRKAVLGSEPHTPRLLTLTQGQMTFVLPRGRGVPVASDEDWSVMFQVLNRNRDGAFRVKQRLTLYFVRDVDLFRPVDAASNEAVSIWVSVDKSSADALRFDAESCHCCAPLGRALEAPNNIAGARKADELGRAFVAHWTVPPGKSTWSYPFKRSATSFDPKGKRVFAAWTHVHPFATEARLSVHAPGCEPKVVLRSPVESLHDRRIGLVQIQPIVDEAGIPLPEVGDYEVAVDYDNTSGVAQDSMTSVGLFVNDDAWKRPVWADRAQNRSGIDESCASP